MLAWLAPLLVFGVVIFVHELGHFLAAKWAGVYTPRFSVGFGKALWRRRSGETEYILAAIPFGGYVRMASKEDEATAFLEGGGETPEKLATDAAKKRPSDWDPDAMIPFGPKPIPPDRWFESKSLTQRLVILVSGVVMNVLLAWVVTIGTFAAYGRAYLPAVVDSVIAGRPAAAAGLQRGDSIVAIEGAPVSSWSEVVERISARPGEATRIEVSRAGERVTLVLTPRPDTATNLITGRTERVGRVGLVPRTEIARERVGPIEAVTTGTRATFFMAGAIVQVVRGLFTGTVGVETLGGPIRIAQTSVEAGRAGFESLLTLLAFISINLAILNLLPIPVLDGGNILIQILEAMKGSPFSPRTRDYILRAGLAFIALLVVVVMYNDISAIARSVARRF
jgi:regulator of sigma E protease